MNSVIKTPGPSRDAGEESEMEIALQTDGEEEDPGPSVSQRTIRLSYAGGPVLPTQRLSSRWSDTTSSTSMPTPPFRQSRAMTSPDTVRPVVLSEGQGDRMIVITVGRCLH